MGSVAVYPARYRVEVDGVAVVATPAEVRVLVRLARRPGWAVGAAELHEEVGGKRSREPASAVRTLVHRLRGRLGAAGAQLQSVRGVGYQLVAGPDAPVIGESPTPAPEIHAEAADS